MYNTTTCCSFWLHLPFRFWNMPMFKTLVLNTSEVNTTVKEIHFFFKRFSARICRLSVWQCGCRTPSSGRKAGSSLKAANCCSQSKNNRTAVIFLSKWTPLPRDSKSLKHTLVSNLIIFYYLQCFNSPKFPVGCESINSLNNKEQKIFTQFVSIKLINGSL